ncbi:uncharacterized protein [Dermacentor albipictus]|uniref:uncharacterized protein isoform X2 n=1 Tax=Dermacentor albipictus TaxID=60249 RepID=UPI0038FD107B
MCSPHVVATARVHPRGLVANGMLQRSSYPQALHVHVLSTAVNNVRAKMHLRLALVPALAFEVVAACRRFRLASRSAKRSGASAPGFGDAVAVSCWFGHFQSRGSAPSGSSASWHIEQPFLRTDPARHRTMAPTPH